MSTPATGPRPPTGPDVPGPPADLPARLVALTSSSGAAPLVVLAGLTAAGRRELVAAAAGRWRTAGTAVLQGRSAAAPAGGAVTAVYDAVLDGLPAPGADAVPAQGRPGPAARQWADVVRSLVPQRRLVLVLHEVDPWRPDERAFLEALAGDLFDGRPGGSLVVNPAGTVPPEWRSQATVHCPEQGAPRRIVDASGALHRIDPALAGRLEGLTHDRQVMLDAARVWRREERIRLVDGVWLPAGPLPDPELPFHRPYLAALNTLTDGQRAVLAAVAVLSPLAPADLVDLFATAFPHGGARRVLECCEALADRGLVTVHDGELRVTDPLHAAAVAGQVGPAQRELWNELLAARRGAGRGPVPREETGVPSDGVVAGEELLHAPGDGELVVETARRWAVRPEAGPSWSPALAAVVLARRGRLDRAREWFERADRADLAAAPARGEAVRWAAAEVGLVAAGPDAAELRREALRCEEAVLGDPSSAAAGHPDGRGGAAADAEGFFAADRRLRELLESVGSAGIEPVERTHRLRAVLAQARERRSVLLWCRAAQLARAAGLGAGPAPAGPDGVDDVVRALLSLLAAGLTTKQCAQALSLQMRAVEKRIGVLFEQTGTSSRAQLVREYVNGGICDLSV